MPDMRVQGSSSSYSPTYFQSLTKNNKKDSSAAGKNDNTDNIATGVSNEASVSGVQKKEDKSGTKIGKNPSEKTGDNSNGNNELSDADKTTVQRMKAIENVVIAHEQAHKSAGGSLAGPASYSYSTGPDGKRYISGGEVSISTPATDDKERKVKLLDRVKQAALAPAQPSPQDIRVAAGATSEQLQLNAAIQREKGIKAYGGDKKGQGDSPNDSQGDSKSVDSGSRQGNKINNQVQGQYFDQVG